MSESSVEDVLHGARELRIEVPPQPEDPNLAPKRNEPHRASGVGPTVWIFAALVIALVVAIAVLR